MEEKTPRRQYDREFKAEAVRLVTESGLRPDDVARELGISSKMLGQWRRHRAQQQVIFPRKRGQVKIEEYDETCPARAPQEGRTLPP